MILTSHIITATALSSQTSNVWLVGILAILSHYLLDALPHIEYDVKILKNRDADYKKRSRARAKVYTDFLIGIIFASLLAYYNNFLHLVAFIIFFSVLPDILLYLHWQYPDNKLLSKLWRFHHFIHIYKKRGRKLPKWMGALTQVIVILVSLWILL